MSCLHPLKAVPYGIRKDTGKTAYRIVSFDWHDDKFDESLYGPVVEIPCGVCAGCRKQAAFEWTQRAVAEMKLYDCYSFVTLTYDDEHIPKSDKDTFTLVYADLQKFFKRLRKAHDDLDIRYFACGEYGSHTMRPHYHAVIYGYDFPDRQFLKFSAKGSMLYTSAELSRLWPFGLVSVGDVTPATCGYVAGYIASKIGKYRPAQYKEMGLLPPKLFASRNPALGRRWFESNMDRFKETDLQYVATDSGSFGIGLTKYFKKIIDTQDKSWYTYLKDSNRVKSEYVRDAKLAQTDADYLKLLESEEVRMMDAVKANKRNLEVIV